MTNEEFEELRQLIRSGKITTPEEREAYLASKGITEPVMGTAEVPPSEPIPGPHHNLDLTQPPRLRNGESGLTNEEFEKLRQLVRSGKITTPEEREAYLASKGVTEPVIGTAEVPPSEPPHGTPPRLRNGERGLTNEEFEELRQLVGSGEITTQEEIEEFIERKLGTEPVTGVPLSGVEQILDPEIIAASTDYGADIEGEIAGSNRRLAYTELGADAAQLRVLAAVGADPEKWKLRSKEDWDLLRSLGNAWIDGVTETQIQEAYLGAFGEDTASPILSSSEPLADPASALPASLAELGTWIIDNGNVSQESPSVIKAGAQYFLAGQEETFNPYAGNPSIRPAVLTSYDDEGADLPTGFRSSVTTAKTGENGGGAHYNWSSGKLGHNTAAKRPPTYSKEVPAAGNNARSDVGRGLESDEYKQAYLETVAKYEDYSAPALGTFEIGDPVPSWLTKELAARPGGPDPLKDPAYLAAELEVQAKTDRINAAVAAAE